MKLPAAPLPIASGAVTIPPVIMQVAPRACRRNIGEIHRASKIIMAKIGCGAATWPRIATAKAR